MFPKFSCLEIDVTSESLSLLSVSLSRFDFLLSSGTISKYVNFAKRKYCKKLHNFKITLFRKNKMPRRELSTYDWPFVLLYTALTFHLLFTRRFFCQRLYNSTYHWKLKRGGSCHTSKLSGHKLSPSIQQILKSRQGLHTNMYIGFTLT